MNKQKFFPLIFFALCVAIFFRAFLIRGELPIPSDTIIGLYHPFRDLYAKDYPRGITFKNFLITDPVRQQYPWRQLAISLEKKFQLPLWNPYSFAGTPLLANFQSAPFYLLNILYVFLPFSIAWSIQVVLQPLLAGFFLYFYLLFLKTRRMPALLGAFVYAFSGFSVVWMEWNTIGQVALWLPLVLLAKEHLLKKISFQWICILMFAEISQIFAGHLQTLFYALLVSNVYLFSRILQISFTNKDRKTTLQNVFKLYFPFLLIGTVVLVIGSIVLLPTTQFILDSGRNVDQINNWQKVGWFIPWQHLIQFIAPDFFGNPTTLNYWGEWNYAEFVGYIGIFPLLIAIFCMFFRHDKKTLFFGSLFFLSLLFSLPTFFAKMPFIFDVPFFSTSQPTRLLFITDFSLAILSALGFDYFLRRQQEIVYPLGFLAMLFGGLWFFVLYGNQAFLLIKPENFEVARRNLIFPTVLYMLCAFLSLLLLAFYKRNQRITIIISIAIVGLTVFDLLRFGQKFTPFTAQEYLFPQTKITSFLQKQPGYFRIMSTDDRILPPNFETMYKIQSIDGYDPLYLRRYAELIAASERGKPDIAPPFGFNRIIVPHKYDSKIIDLLGVKYILSLSDINSPKLTKVFQEGETRVYENKDVLPRAFFVGKIKKIYNSDKQQVIENMFSTNIDFRKEAIVEFYGQETRDLSARETLLIGRADIINYSENTVAIKTQNAGIGFLVLTDSFYPTWIAKVDGEKTNIYKTNYNFRGIYVPEGNHTIEFFVTLL